MLLVVACEASPGTTPIVVEGVWWQAVSVDGRQPRAGAEPRLRLVGGRIEGTTGCNSFGGDARIVDARLEAPELAMTLIGCEDDVAGIERAFMAVLAGADLATDGTNLILRGEGGEVVLAPGAAPPAR